MWWIPYGVTPSIDCKLFEDTDHYTPKVLYNAQGLKKQFFNLGFSTGVTLLTQGHLATSGDICGCPNWHLEDRDQGYLVLNLLQWAEQHPHQELSGLQSQERPHWEPRANGWTPFSRGWFHFAVVGVPKSFLASPSAHVSLYRERLDFSRNRQHAISWEGKICVISWLAFLQM